ncbi:MAG TPA: hypothetical protein PKY81_09400 [bacterium]|nr:hypothetical protein [bacterium]HPN31160.1 hypothetical protein [bacterium]
MKGLILYYSRTNKTRYVAEILKDTLDKLDMFEIIEKNFSLRYGIFGFFKSGFDSMFNKKTDIVKTPDFSIYDLIVICCPVWAGKPAVPMRQIIEDNSLILQNKIKFIITTSGSKNLKAFRLLEKLSGKVETSINFSALSNEKPKIKALIDSDIQNLAKHISAKL